MAENKVIIGWQEIVALPQINLPALRVKVDTGAKTSSLHAENIKYFTEGEIEYITFDVHPVQKNKDIVIHCQAPLSDKRNVKSSSGYKENRPMIKTNIKIGDYVFEIDLNLTKRDYMGFRMLLGRDAMKGNIVIDPEHKFLHGRLSNRDIKLNYKKPVV